MKYLELIPEEIVQIDALLNHICHEDAVETANFLQEAHILAHELPKRIRREFYRFKLNESSLGICVKHNPMRKQEDIGLTPNHIPVSDEKAMTTREEVLHILYASLLGEVFSWSSIQNGNLVNEVIPLRENEQKPMSSGSANSFAFHTEDAFHPYAGDYFGLMCLRNPTHTPTVISSLEGIDLAPQTKAILFQPRFVVGPNIAHTVAPTCTRVPILFGSEQSPYLRINLNSDADLQADSEAQAALAQLIAALNKNAVNVILTPGDCLYLDNFRAVHGRSSYRPRYDGTDRWLKRLYITAYLRKSRDMRSDSGARIILSKPHP